MDNKFLEELGQFQQHASRLQAVVSQMNSDLPEAADGRDAHGAVEVRVRNDGLPQRIAAASDWQRRCGPEQLGAAVVDACGAAAFALISAWSRGLASRDWRAGASGVNSPAAVGPFDEASPMLGQSHERDRRQVVARPLDEVAEDVIASLTHLDNPAADAGEGVPVRGSDAGRHVSITLSPGSLSACEVDSEWARKQSSFRLNRAIEEARRDAHNALRQSQASDSMAGSQQQLSSLLDEAMATLHDPGV